MKGQLRAELIRTTGLGEDEDQAKGRGTQLVVKLVQTSSFAISLASSLSEDRLVLIVQVSFCGAREPPNCAAALEGKGHGAAAGAGVWCI